MILSVISLLDFFSFTHIVYRSFGPPEVVAFNSGLDFSFVLILLTSLSVMFMFLRGTFFPIVGSFVFSLFIGLFWAWNIGLVALAFSSSLILIFHVRNLEKTLFWFFIFAGGFEFLCLVYWAVKPFGIGLFLQVFSDLERSLYYLGIPIAPVLSLGVLLSWFISYFSRFIQSPSFFEMSIEPENPNDNSRWVDWLFAFLILFSISLVFYVYSSRVNPGNKPLGVDFSNYVALLDEMGDGVFSAFRILDNSRPVFLLLLFGFKSLFGFSSYEAVKFFPMLLCPVLVFSVYFMSYQLIRSKKVAVFSSFFSLAGSLVVVGLGLYYLTNMLALSLIFISIGFLFKALAEMEVKYLLIGCFVYFLVLYTHLWTFFQYYVAFILFGFLTFFNKVGMLDEKKKMYLYVFIVLSGLFFFHRLFAVGGARMFSDLYGAGIVFQPFTIFWDNMLYGFYYFSGGALSNLPYLILVLLGASCMEDDFLKMLIFSLFLTSSMMYLVSDGIFMSRLLYNLPLSFIAGHGLSHLVSTLKESKNLKTGLSFFICSYFLVFLFRFLSLYAS